MAPLAVRAPLLWPATALVAGAWLAGRAQPPSVPCLVALAALGLALHGRQGVVVACLAVGTLWSSLSWVEPHRRLAGLAAGRPVVLVGEVSGCWSRETEGDAAWLLARWAHQGREVVRVAGRVRVHLPVAAAPRGCGGGLEVRGTLRAPKLYRNAVDLAVGGWSVWVKSLALASDVSPPGPLSRVSSSLRLRLFPDPPTPPSAGEGGGGEDVPSRELPGTGRGSAPGQAPRERPGLQLARALLLGDGNALPAAQREAMRRVGLAHLVAVSGLNVGMVAVFFMTVLLATPRPIRLAGTLIAIALYGLLVGPAPSLLRALLMAAVVLVGLLLHRLPQSANGLASACLLMVLLAPSWVEDLGFQLSVAATLGLLTLTRPLALRLRRCGPLALPLAVTLAAQLSTLPWALAAFYRLSPVAPLANLLFVPWSAVALSASLVWASLRLLLGAAADLLLPVLDMLAAPLAWLPHLPASAWVTFPVRTGWCAAWAVTALLVWWAVRAAGRIATWAPPAAAAMLLAFAARTPAAGIEVVMLDVGQGDAVLLRDGPRAVLIDGGGWRQPGFGGRVLVPALGTLGVRRLAALVVTHADVDHCGGAADLLAELPVAELWLPSGGLPPSSCADRLLAAPGPPARELMPGEVRAVGRWRLRALGPPLAPGPANDNDGSLVLLASAGGRRVLLTGDVETAGETALLTRWGEAGLRCDLLKVAHHGSRSSSGRSFLAVASPRLALVSAGSGNPYGHPSPVVTARLASSGVRLLRTDLHGMVAVSWLPGGGWRVRVAAP